MCMSPHEMSDDRIREAIEYFDRMRVGGSAYFQRQFDNFTGLLAERDAQRAADVEEVFAAMVPEGADLVTV